jgi:aryl-phospho-beta-D-glucosidase BglC (GH1 family)
MALLNFRLMKIHVFLSGLAVLLCTACSRVSAPLPDAQTIAPQMYPGWNLGNTFEAGNQDHLFTDQGGLAGETAWQDTRTTREIIGYVKSLGFRSVRIPCAWVMGHVTDSVELTVDPAWMSRIREVVGWCIADSLYVILNDHWDGGWLENSFYQTDSASVALNCTRLRRLWTQIATAFRDCDGHLLFAGLNEPMNNDNSVFRQPAAVDALLAYEQTFIDAVRATGGRNATRVLVVQGPATDIDITYQCYDVTRLRDTAPGRLMVEVHYYTPWNFCGMERDESWGTMFYYWGEGNESVEAPGRNTSWGGEDFLDGQFRKMHDKFVSKGYPVIIGEYGTQWRMTGDSLHNASVRAFHRAVNRSAVSNGCVPFVWGTNYTGFPAMTVINRATLSVFNPHAMEGIREGVAEASWPE